MKKERPLFFFILFPLLFFVSVIFIHFKLPHLVVISSFLTIFLVTHFYYEIKTRRFKTYENIYKTILQLFHYTEFSSFLDYAIHSISKLLNAERTTIFMLNQETKVLWTFFAEELEIKEVFLPITEGIVGYVARTKKIVKINDDVYKDERFSPIVDQKTGFRTKTVLCAPIIERTKGNVIGVIEVLNKKTKNGFTKEDEELLELFCHEISTVIVNAQLYTQLKALLESFLKSFAIAIDARDPVTKGHSIRVMRYALRIGKEMRLSHEQLKVLEYASILHDIGKVGIPDNILLKPEKFTPEEYEIMKKHVNITKDILSTIQFPPEYKDVPTIAAMHHEFLDGSGYPEGLKGEEIPLLARIICIADIYDALVSYDRPYKPAYSNQEAINILYDMANSGKLDKTILDIFVLKEPYQIEQRKFLRLNKEVSFSWKKLTPEGIKSLLPTLSKTVNVSERTLQFICDEPLSVNSFLDMEIYLPDFHTNAIAKVVYCSKTNGEEKYKVGINFVNLSKKLEEKLQTALAKASD